MLLNQIIICYKVDLNKCENTFKKFEEKIKKKMQNVDTKILIDVLLQRIFHL